MHEFSLCQRLIEELRRSAAAQGFGRVGRIRLEVGRLAAVDGEALRFGFELVSRGTLAEGAVLELIEVAGRGRCRACGAEAEMAGRADPCPRCGTFGLEVVAGDGLWIRDVEVA